MPRRSAAPEAPAQPGRWPTAPDAPVATRKRSRRRLQIVPQPAPPAEEPSPDETLPPDAPPESLPQHPPEPLANPLPPEKRPLPPAAINFAARKAKPQPNVPTLLESFTQHRLNLEYPQVLDDARRLLFLTLQIEEHLSPEGGHHHGQDVLSLGHALQRHRGHRPHQGQRRQPLQGPDRQPAGQYPGRRDQSLARRGGRHQQRGVCAQA